MSATDIEALLIFCGFMLIGLCLLIFAVVYLERK